MPNGQNLNSDYGYYNYIINNQNHTKVIEATLDETRITPVLSHQEDWQVAVCRFKVPSISIPLFIFEEDLIDDPANPGQKIYQSPYWISFSIGDNYTNPLRQNVEFIEAYANNEITKRPQSRFLYYYRSFLTMINDAIEELWGVVCGTGAYTTAFPSITAGFYPYLELVPGDSYVRALLPYFPTVVQPCPFIAETGLPAYINMHMSPKLYYFFSGFASKLLSPPPLPNMDYVLQFNIPTPFDRILNLPPWGSQPALPLRAMVSMVQDYSCLYLWQKLSRILLTTTIPVEQELVGVRDLNGNNYTVQILTDFEIPPNREGNQRDYIFFFPEGSLRYANFTSNGSLRKFDLKILFQTNDLETFPVEIPPGFEATVKLQFKRRKAQNLLQYGENTIFKYR